MECMNDKCANELTGRQKRFCSDKCRMSQTRTNKRRQDALGCSKSNKPEQIHQPEHKSNTVIDEPPDVIPEPSYPTTIKEAGWQQVRGPEPTVWIGPLTKERQLGRKGLRG